MKKSIAIILSIILILAITLPATAASTSVKSNTKIDTSKFLQLKMMMVGDKGKDTDRIFSKINEKLKKDLNCSLSIECTSWSGWDTQYPLIFASGEDFDMAYTSNWCFYSTEAIKGAFLELTTDKLQKYMPLSYAAVNKLGGWPQTKINGKIYMIPTTAPNYGMTNNGQSNSQFLVRGDLMKKYGISKISSANDMIKYWDSVKKNDPSIIPIAIGGEANGVFGWWLAQTFSDLKYYGKNYFTNAYFQRFDTSDPNNIKVMDTVSTDLASFKLLNEFKKKGYWSKDAIMQKDDCLTMFQNGKSASAIRQLGNINLLYANVKTKNPSWDPKIVDINPGKPAYLSPLTNNGMAIHATSKNMERSMMVLDQLGYNQSYFDLGFYGVKGTDWTANTDGSVHSMNTGLSCSGWMGLQNTPMRKPELRAPNYDSIMDSFAKNQITPALSMFNFDSSKLNTQVSSLSSVVAKYLPILNLGMSDDVKGTYDKMIAQLKASGLKDIQKEYLKQAQMYMKSYGK